MAWTRLRRCYRFRLRLWVDGQLCIVPARWYWSPPGAKWFPNWMGFDAKAWWRQNEDWPDSFGEADATWHYDRGQNPGYAGQCYVGQKEWFLTGSLSSVPDCCRPPVAVATGSIILAGVASPFLAPQASGTGQLVLRGAASASAWSASGSGYEYECSWCPDGAPLIYVLQVVGFPGAWAYLNGNINCYYSGPFESGACTWVGTVGSVVYSITWVSQEMAIVNIIQLQPFEAYVQIASYQFVVPLPLGCLWPSYGCYRSYDMTGVGPSGVTFSPG